MTPPPDWSSAFAPSLDEFAALADAALAALPARFRALVGEVEMRVLEYAEDEVLDDLGIEDPFQLTGLYQGPDLTQRSTFDLAPRPSMLFLYRRAILDEWCERGDVTLGELITHVLVHEIGHHFGFSDDDIHAIEERGGR
jgi:predicted Zn-dependent protease with MMP-like domain